MRFGDLRHYCGISVMLGGVQYDLGLHGAVVQLRTPDTG